MTAETIRRAHPSDIEGIQHVASETWHETYDDILGADVVDALLDEWYEDDALEASIDQDAQDFFVATVDKRVVGFAHVGPHPPRRIHQLYRIYVRPDHWGEGIGKHLLTYVEQALDERDVRIYEAEVFADNDRGVSFHESTGFDRVAESETEHKGVTVTEYRYEKRI